MTHKEVNAKDVIEMDYIARVYVMVVALNAVNDIVGFEETLEFQNFQSCEQRTEDDEDRVKHYTMLGSHSMENPGLNNSTTAVVELHKLCGEHEDNLVTTACLYIGSAK